MPALQVSLVHWLPSSAGTSLSSTTFWVFPTPSQTLSWQSPGVEGTTVPFGTYEKPQTPALQVRVRQAVSVPGQSAPVVHCIVQVLAEQTPLQHWELPTQKPPPGTHGGWHWLPVQMLLQQSPF